MAKNANEVPVVEVRRDAFGRVEGVERFAGFNPQAVAGSVAAWVRREDREHNARCDNAR